MLSRGRFTRQYDLWNKYLPSVRPYYAVKCNPDPVLLRWLMEGDVGFDCASAREMILIKNQFKNQPIYNKVLLANPCKTPYDIQIGKDLKIPWVTADSVEELVKMNESGYYPEVLLRVAVDDSGSACPFNTKFGLEPDKVDEIAYAAKNLNIPVVGLSFHVGSGSSSTKAFGAAIDVTKDVWKRLEDKKFVNIFKALDIGGGWSPEPNLFQDQAFHAMSRLIYGPHPFQVIAEPGRFFAAPTHDLYVRIVGKKPRTGGGWRYTLDESIYGQFSCIPFDHAMPKMARISLDKNEAPRKKTAATFFGRTCDSLDWIGESELTEELEVGDWLYMPNMGAYTTATATEFNGFPKPISVETDELIPENNLQWITNMQFPLANMLSTKIPASLKKIDSEK